MAKVPSNALRKAENWRVIGRAVERTRALAGTTLKEFADAIDCDERQVAKWIAGQERPQVDAIFAIRELRGLLVLALAELADDAAEVVTEIRIRSRRRA
jgi:transcriptional regulator with XRE-family HTH domain